MPGGISGKLINGFDAMKQSFDKVFKFLKFPQILSALNLLVTLHNAAFLSKSLVETLGSVLSEGLSLIGIKDEEGNALDINKELGKQATDFIKDLIGAENFNNLVTRLQSANRIYQAAANVAYSIRSIADSTNAMVELAAENTGRIGNALKKFRVVGEKAFPWMPENVTPSSAVMNRLQNLDDAASALSSVVSETTSLVSEVNELRENRSKFKETLETELPKVLEDNKPIKKDEDESKLVSTAPDLSSTPKGPGEV
jgi:hypothetical protein